MRPQLGVARPSSHAAAEEVGKPVGSRAVRHGGGCLGMRSCGDSQGTVHGLKGPAQFGHPLVRPLTKLLERLGMLGGLGEVDQFIGILLEVVEELVVFLVDVANVLVAVGAQTFEGGDAMTHGKVLVKGLLAPVVRLAGGHDGLEAAPLVALRRGDAGPVKKGGRQVEVESGILHHLPAGGLGGAGVVDDHGYAEGFLVVRPFAGEPAVAHMVAVICGVYDDRVVGQALRLESLYEPSDCIVDSAHHAEVGPHVGAVLGFGVPAPEEALAIDRGLEEVGLLIEDIGIVQSGRGNLVLLVHPVDCPGPWKVPDAGTAVTVLRVTGIEPHIKGEGFVLRLVLDELDSAVHDHLGLVAQGTIGLLLVKRVAADLLENVEVVGGLPAPGHLGVPLARESGAITSLAEQVDVELLYDLGAGGVMPARGTIASPREAGQYGGSADPANGLADEGIGEARAFRREAVDVRRLDQGMSVAREGARGLVVGKEEDDVGLLGALRKASGQDAE